MNQKKKIYLASGILGIITAVLSLFAAFPLFQNIQNNSAELISGEETIALLEAESKNIKIIKNRYEDYRPDIEKIDSLFINPEVPVDFIRFLEKVATDSEISIVITPSSEQKSSGQLWSFFSFQLAVTGKFLDFSRFLEKLENSNFLIEVQSLSIKKIKKLAPSSDISANILIKVFTK